MRLALTALLILTGPALAETYTATSAPTSVTVYPGFATVTRQIDVAVAAGAHEIILPDLPRGIDPARLRVTVDGATLRSTRLRQNALPPAPDADTPEITAARAEVEQAEEDLRQLDDRIEDARLVASAAEARVTFLSGLWSSKTLPSDPDALANVARMIEAQTLSGTQARVAAERSAREISAQRPDLEEALSDARAALAALTPPADPGALLVLSISVPDAGEVTVSTQYPVSASWQPTYDLFLDRETETLALRRGATVFQNSAESWRDVRVTLSTLSPSGQVSPSTLFPPLLRFEEPGRAQLQSRAAASDFAAAVEPVMAESGAVAANFDGPGVSYPVPESIDIAPGADGARVALDTLRFDARLFARAVPAFDTTAFLMAEAVNSSAEPLLAAPVAQLFVDGGLVGQTAFAAVAAGASITQAFGPIEDLRLTRTVLDRSDGDRGIINRSNQRLQFTRLEIENLGQESWEVELREAVPYSEQDDLTVNWAADPAPTTANVDDTRGLLEWSFTLGAGGERAITLEQDIRWPEGTNLR
ncbi:mucoidy inhibitor MuiA family protein [Sulfitobacter albidus]|uniref:Mucoidy inhibitor MuiA family protein n=1 Tax=Sulfitobacter albidus TaxID=2829501 RepID=A0A975PM56_9RHOB|nr:DUF4139 domain-containing protein [Sulfitobacter albidus]QUJ76443.1 mucoidy inhibitor MuiA family protein [Sulfitobacter albidus]